MKRLGAATQAEIRRRVMAAIAEGMRQAQAARTFGVGERSVHRWVAQVRGGGDKAIAPKRRGRRMGEGSKLTPLQGEHIKGRVMEYLPEQLGLPFYLWTRQAVQRLIERECGVKLGLSTVGNALKAWGLSAQRPVARAYKRDPAAIARWIEEEYPRIAQQAKHERAAMYWGDETGFRSDDTRGRSFSARGHTPGVAGPGKRFGCQMLSALTNHGALAFMVFEGRFRTPVFIRFLERLLKHTQGRKVYLIVDGHPVHKARIIQDWVVERSAHLRLILLPGYAPELNPDELVNHDIKQAVGKVHPPDRQRLKATVRQHMHRRQHQPQVVRHFFDEEHVRYAA